MRLCYIKREIETITQIFLFNKKYEADNYVLNRKKETDEPEKTYKILISEVDSNFSQISVDSKKNMNDEQKYHEKVNASSLEEECKTYILSKINNLINENKEQIQIIEIYKITTFQQFYINNYSF